MRFSTTFLIFLLQTTLILADTTRIVESNNAKYRGHLSSDGFYQYLGIRYGSVPENPFAAASPFPLPEEPNNDIQNSEDDVVHCPQTPNGGVVTGSASCLTLHVFTPRTVNNTSKVPVIIWIYGEDFHTGYTDTKIYGPKFLVRHDVIVVTFNYRTGPYGFMCLKNAEVPGNQGLKDQYLAIKWVKDNIQPFGGDPNRIAVMGLGTGAQSVDLHLLSERERLFSNAIIQSGSAVATSLLHPPDRDAAVKIAQYIGFSGDDTKSALRYMKDRSPREVMQAAYHLRIQFKPCVEGRVEGIEPFISYKWVNTSSAPNVAGVSIMTGFVEQERMLQHINQGQAYFQKLNIFNESVEQVFDLDNETKVRMARYLKRFYVRDDPITQESVWGLINFDSDFENNYPTQRSIKKFLENNAARIYYYMFTYVGDRNINRILYDATLPGAAHGDEIGYLFDSPHFPSQITAQDQLMIDRMTTMWTNFAKYSDPTPQTTSLLPTKWVPLDTQKYRYLQIDTNLTMQSRPLQRRMAFMELFYRLNNDKQRAFDAADIEVDDDGNSASVKTGSLLLLLLNCIIFLMK